MPVTRAEHYSKMDDADGFVVNVQLAHNASSGCCSLDFLFL